MKSVLLYGMLAFLLADLVFMGGVSASFCDQEQANSSSSYQCGNNMQSTGSYNATGTCTGWYNFIDGNVLTYFASNASGVNCNITINYTKPSYSLINITPCVSNGDHSSCWYPGSGGIGYYMPSSCKSAYVDKVIVQYHLIQSGLSSLERAYCDSGSGVFVCMPDTSSGTCVSYDTNGYEYEEGIRWNITEFCPAGTSYCGGYNSQMIVRCSNESVYYKWSDNETFCPFGCYNASCVTQNATCSNVCSVGSTTCDEDKVVYCQEASNGCYEWSSNVSYCSEGCYRGSCISLSSSCSYGSMLCSNNAIYNCTNNSGTWGYSFDQQCTYGCEYYYFGDTLLNASCTMVGDAHQTANAVNLVYTSANYIFGPMVLGVYMLGLIILCGFVSVKSHAPGIGIWLFLLGIAAGAVPPILIVPWWLAFLVAVLVLGFKAYGGLDHD